MSQIFTGRSEFTARFPVELSDFVRLEFFQAQCASSGFTVQEWPENSKAAKAWAETLTNRTWKSGDWQLIVTPKDTSVMAQFHYRDIVPVVTVEQEQKGTFAVTCKLLFSLYRNSPTLGRSVTDLIYHTLVNDVPTNR